MAKSCVANEEGVIVRSSTACPYTEHLSNIFHSPPTTKKQQMRNDDGCDDFIKEAAWTTKALELQIGRRNGNTQSVFVSIHIDRTTASTKSRHHTSGANTGPRI